MRLTPALSGLALLIMAPAALAQTAPAQPTIEAPRPTPEAAAPIQPASAPRPLDAQELAALDGKQGSTILSQQDLTAINRGNTITANTVGSGPISIGPGAFDGFAGIGNFVINSGHNNNLQGALTINIVSP